ncbi:MAG TPA: caspase family protein [Thermoanaerobaculia bacterium]|jgi:hypothetical protein|nr:caspase family protein [Thermoanaerobaculia bacterium]
MKRQLLVRALFFFCFASGAYAAPAKYAMLVGINKYPGNALNGCVNDVTNLREMLVDNFGFPAENVVMLTDEEATRENILAKLDGFGAKLHRDDLFVFAYSGHGTLFPDAYSEEQDETESLHFPNDPRNENKPFFEDGKYDAAICPVDSRGTSSGKPWHNLILDDELYARFSKYAAQGTFINYLTDSCFSGTQGRDLYKTRSLKLTDALGVPLSQIQKPATQHRAASRDVGGRYLVISSSNSLQPSSEWRDDKGQPCGLFSYVFQKLVKLQGGKISYKELYEGSEYVIKQLSKDNQDPQMDTRYYSGSLDEQVFAIPGAAAPAAAAPAPTPTPAPAPAAAPAPAPTPAPVAAPTPLKVMLLVTDPSGRLLDKCSFAIFKPGVKPVKGEIKREDILMLGRTNENGVFDSDAKGVTIAPGTYPIKVVREGYQTFLSTLEVRQGAKAGYAVLAFRLTAE